MIVADGLSEPDNGQALIFGARYRREALAVSARTMGVPVQRVDELLKLVSLDVSSCPPAAGPPPRSPSGCCFRC